MMAFGLEDLVVIIIKKKKNCYKDISFLHGIFELVLGLIMILLIRDFVEICVIWAIWSMMRELFEVHEIFSGKVKGVLAVVSMIESLVVFVFSILLIITPSEYHAKTHIYLLIAELIITSFSPVFNELIIGPIKARRARRKQNKQSIEKEN